MKNSFVPPATGIHTHTCVAYLKGTIYNVYIYMFAMELISGVLLMHGTFHFIYANAVLLMEMNLNNTTFMHLFRVDREINTLIFIILTNY